MMSLPDAAVLAACTDAELRDLSSRVLAEQERRLASTTVLDTLGEANKAHRERLGINPGDPYRQPTSVIDAYRQGDTVTEDGKVFRAVADWLVWPPSVLPNAWVAVTAPASTPAPTAGPAEWAATSSYRPGDVVIFKGVVYRARQSVTPNPGWTPDIVPALWARQGA